MKNLFKVLLGVGLLGCISAIAAAPSQAQPAYGSYIGVGGSFGLSEGTPGAGEGKTAAGVIALRYKFLEMPVSLRTQVLIGTNTAVVPTISYDLPINFDTDVYLGVGAAIANSNTPVGNKSSFVLQPGVDYTVPNSNMVVFANAIFAFDAYRTTGGTATSVQTGVGFRF
ncbi:hypothetical protein [Pseudanabaena sp. PCC 6802]|uniref:hypothetical protein n=1 Tax=Pseudanabaena sp. PCC 6802 TaxID=118173 RepID=UPI00034D35BE|nr:hypothetical protein [Pseudanabaena sp. PCC 6802]